MLRVAVWLLVTLPPAGLAWATVQSGRLLSVNGTELFVTVEGAGPPVLLVHGGFMDSTMWDGLAAVLKQDFQVIRPDLRGFGRSPRSRDPYSAEDDMRAVLDELGVKQTAVVGLSMGGGVAIDCALAHPERVRSLLLAEPALSGWEWSSDVTGTMATVAEAGKRGGRAAAIETMLDQPVFATAKQRAGAHEAIRAQLEKNFTLTPVLMRMLRPLAVGRLAEIRTPTLVLVAEHGGPDARGIAEKIMQEVPKARLRIIAGAGHMINFERPDVFAAVTRDFLRAH